MTDAFPGQVDLLVTNCVVACCDHAGTVHDPGALAVHDGRIAWVGPAAAVPAGVDAWRHDGGGGLLVPGLVNVHCHLADSLFRGLVEDLPLEPWLQRIWQAEGAVLSPATTALGARLGLAELALAGVTCINDMFWYPDAAARAAVDMGMRIVTGGLFFDAPGMDGKQPQDRLPDARVFCDAWAGEELVSLAVTPHGAYTVGPDSLQAAHALAVERDALFHIHAAETRAENAIVADKYGRSVVRHLHGLGVLGPRTLLAHCVHVDAAEIDLIAASATPVAHNPVSNLKLGSGICPLPALLDAGVVVGLGTDGAVSGNDLDPWLALRLAATMHRGAAQDPVAVRAGDALRLATLDGARALGMADRIGSLEVGKAADLVLLDTRRPHARPLYDANTHLVFGAAKGDVTDVWVAGRPVVAGREPVGVDLAGLLAEVDELAPRIKAALA